MLTNLLADVSLQLFDVNGEITLNILEKFIGILIGAVGITGLGIILYCLILKFVTLPLDIWQKSTSRKQSLKMEQMRGQLEKLQKQYANSPELYQKKIQEVYKENNYSMFSSCIPMIATLVILMVAFSSLTGYSQHMNLQIYTDMASAYDAAILEHYDNSEETEYTDGNGVEYVKYEGVGEEYYIYSITPKNAAGDTEYYIDLAKLTALHSELETEEECLTYVKNLGRSAAEASFHEKVDSFLWIKNIYYSDVAWAHPLQDYSDFCSAITRDITLMDENGVSTGNKVDIEDFINENTYEEITYNLETEKSQANGYFILVVLTILANLASQFISMRSQKAQRELQTTDQSQGSQKWMMIIMPLIYCVFAFIYSAAFSLYLITSSLFSLASTLIINKVIDAKYKKPQAAESTTRTRVNTNGRKAYSRDWKRNEELRNEDKNDKKK